MTDLLLLSSRLREEANEHDMSSQHTIDAIVKRECANRIDAALAATRAQIEGLYKLSFSMDGEPLPTCVRLVDVLAFFPPATTQDKP